MLPTKILKLRLARIAKGKDHLSTQDKLMLVTMESPDLSANFLLRLFKLSLPKQWQFQHATEEDILYSSQLIQLIEDELIAAYDFHARKHAWYEQCLAYRLKFLNIQPTPSQINFYVRQLDKCLDQQPKIDLLAQFQQHYPSPQYALALAKAYAGAQQYTAAIQYYEWTFEQQKQRNETAFYAYIECLLSRHQPEYKTNISDLEYAIDLLIKFKQPIDEKNYQNTLAQAITLALPASIVKTRAIETHLFTDMGRGLNLLGKSLFKGRDYYIPYHKEVIASAPTLLSNTIILEHLIHSQQMQHALQRLLNSEQNLNEQVLPAQLLKAFWQAIQQDPEILKLLAQPSQPHALIHHLQQVKLVEEKPSDLEQIQMILDQGLTGYLGELRPDKQHPKRTNLYEQRDAIVAEMVAFAVWFQQHVLKSERQQQNLHFQQIQALMTAPMAEVSLSSGIFAYQFEQQQRVQDLFDWMQQKLEKSNQYDHVQAAWVALRESVHFNMDGLQQRIEQIQAKLQHYKLLRDMQCQAEPEMSKQEGITDQENPEFQASQPVSGNT